MNRRSFFTRVAGALAGTALAKSLPPAAPVTVPTAAVVSSALPAVRFVTSQYVPQNTMYFLNAKYVYQLTSDNPRRFGVVTGITE